MAEITGKLVTPRSDPSITLIPSMDAAIEQVTRCWGQPGTAAVRGACWETPSLRSGSLNRFCIFRFLSAVQLSRNGHPAGLTIIG